MIKIGVLFGGSSREREISFAGGRTVFDNLDKSIFEPVPIFLDSLGNLIHLDWQYVYKGTIRDFYPPVSFLPESLNQFQIYIESIEGLGAERQKSLIEQVGKPISYTDLPKLIDFAFLALHGYHGEDGKLQGLLESLSIPYSGSGIRACSIGIDKAFQKKMMERGGFPTPKMRMFSRKDWMDSDDEDNWYEDLVQQIGFPMVVRPANQGSSIGVSIIHQDDPPALVEAINNAFFIKIIDKAYWEPLSKEEKIAFLRGVTDIRTGIGFPMRSLDDDTKFYHPEELFMYVERIFSETEDEYITLESFNSEQVVIVEEFLSGKEFSCVVLRKEDGNICALPPTEIVKGGEVFDYRSKYLAGLSRKVTPIRLPDDKIQAIRHKCEELFDFFEFAVYARIDGFFREDGEIFLNDPNTTSGMLPSSFFFHQAAEIGLNPSEFLTFIIRTSIAERIVESTQLGLYDDLLGKLDHFIGEKHRKKSLKKKIAVILGGYSSERHISVESGRNIFEKLSSSDKYEPMPIFLTGDSKSHELFQIPVNIMLKDNADDIKDKILGYKKHPVIEIIKEECKDITDKYASKSVVFEPQKITYDALKKQVSGVFIALHGRPGEDGEVQAKLQKLKIPFNGSTSDSAAITINKYETLQILKKNGFLVTDQMLVDKNDFISNPQQVLYTVEKAIPYPLIAKPVDDGCSSAVKKIKDRAQLSKFLEVLFRDTEALTETQEKALKLKPKEEFPNKKVALLEKLIDKEDAKYFLEITGGLLTKYDKEGKIFYEVFEPSEALAGDEILSLEEKFLAGEGQNITPARYEKSGDKKAHEKISAQVRETLRRAAEVLNVSGYARIDAFVRVYDDNRAETIVIEVNSLPGMTPATCIFHQTAINGYKPYDFIDRILNFGFERNAKIAKKN